VLGFKGGAFNMCVLILPFAFPSRRFWKSITRQFFNVFLARNGEVTQRPLSQTECLDTNRVTNQVIFTGDASRSQPGCGEMGNSVFDGDG
jgi:hypothetical protein